MVEVSHQWQPLAKLFEIKKKKCLHCHFKRDKQYSCINWHIAISTISATKNAKGNKSTKSKSEYEGKRILHANYAFYLETISSFNSEKNQFKTWKDRLCCINIHTWNVFQSHKISMIMNRTAITSCGHSMLNSFKMLKE